MAVDSGPFLQSALEANKSGTLTDGQRRSLRGASRGIRKSELSYATVAVVLGLLILFGSRSSASSVLRYGFPLVCFVVAAVLVLRAVTGVDKLTRDLRSPRVESIEGGISKDSRTSNSGNSSYTTYYLNVAGQHFEVGHQTYLAAPEAGFVRLFYLSISRHVVNLEHLPDRSIPEGASVPALAQEFAQAIHAHDQARVDELRAEFAGSENQLKASLSDDTVPPPPLSQDARPLAEAILGTWSNGPVTAVFNEGGTFRVRMFGASEQLGRWSVDGNGKLVADFRGRDQTTDAWVAGDQLTVSLGDVAVTLRRVSS